VIIHVTLHGLAFLLMLLMLLM